MACPKHLNQARAATPLWQRARLAGPLWLMPARSQPKPSVAFNIIGWLCVVFPASAVDGAIRLVGSIVGDETDPALLEGFNVEVTLFCFPDLSLVTVVLLLAHCVHSPPPAKGAKKVHQECNEVGLFPALTNLMPGCLAGLVTNLRTNSKDLDCTRRSTCTVYQAPIWRANDDKLSITG